MTDKDWSSLHRQWLNEQRDARHQHICRLYPDSEPTAVITHVDYWILKKLVECRAKTPAQFRAWINRQIDKIANPKPRKRHKNIKPFIYEIHGDKAFIQVSDSRGKGKVWVIPAHWLTESQKLWPCYISHTNTGRPYLTKKLSRLTLSGQRCQFTVAVHHLFVEAQKGDIVEARDGNFLNFTDGNLTIRQASDATLKRYERSDKRRKRLDIEEIYAGN